MLYNGWEGDGMTYDLDPRLEVAALKGGASRLRMSS